MSALRLYLNNHLVGSVLDCEDDVKRTRLRVKKTDAGNVMTGVAGYFSNSDFRDDGFVVIAANKAALIRVLMDHLRWWGDLDPSKFRHAVLSEAPRERRNK